MKKQSIVIGIVAVVVIVGAYCFVAGKKKEVPLVEAPIVTTTEPATDTASTTIEVITPKARMSTAGWKTCRNEKYGYEFKYPGEWYLSSYDRAFKKCDDVHTGKKIRVGEMDLPEPGDTGAPLGRLMNVELYTKKDLNKVVEARIFWDTKKENSRKILAFLSDPENNKKMLRTTLWANDEFTKKIFHLNHIFMINNNTYIYINSGLALDGSFEALPPDLEETILSTFHFIDK